MDEITLDKQIDLQKAAQEVDQSLSPDEVDELHKFSNLGICQVSDDDPELYELRYY